MAAFGRDNETSRVHFWVELEENFTLPQAETEMIRYEDFLNTKRVEYGFDRIGTRFDHTGGRVSLFWKSPPARAKLEQVKKDLDRELPHIAGHKLQFLDEKEAYWRRRRGKTRDRVIVVGDLNVAPHETDVWSHKQLLNVVSHTPPETDRFKAILSGWDWIDVTRQYVPMAEKIFSWWSYRNQDWKLSDRGRRLDHVWASRALEGRIGAHAILRDARDWPQPSDHVPIVVRVERD